MELKDLLVEIDNLKAALEKNLPIEKEWNEKLEKKFRLEWNYNSNHIEGNTLTYGETEILLLLQREIGDHDPRDYEEMKAHDLAIRLVYDHAGDRERPLTEAFIKQLNKVILVSPFWKDAITPGGQKTKRLINVGEYKKHPNSVRLSNGEMFHYAQPEETPGLMGNLLDFYRSAEASNEFHPVVLASLLHYRMVRIHPFDDGNGRTARLLMNYVMLRNGFPPVIVKSKFKKDYLAALSKADSGDELAFARYIANESLWSLQLSLKASKHQSIEEEDDIDKEIALLKRNILSEPEPPPYLKHAPQKYLQHFFDESLTPLLDEISRRLGQFDDLFLSKVLTVLPPEMDSRNYTSFQAVDPYLRDLLVKARPPYVLFNYTFRHLKTAATKLPTAVASLHLQMDRYNYSVRVRDEDGNGNVTFSKKDYLEPFSRDEISTISRLMAKDILRQIGVVHAA